MSLTTTSPDPLTWTIRLKHHKTTLLLHVSPMQTLANLKKDLLAVLQERSSSTFNNHPLPTTPQDILLAKPNDPFDLSQGWDPLEEPDELEDPFSIDEDAPKPRTKKTTESENLKAYGIKDNAVLAFRFRGEGGGGGEWDVVQAVYIDEYGVENEADMGVPKEYKG